MNNSNRVVPLVLLAVLAALAVFCIPKTADAQIRPALVKNVDEPGRVPYQKVVAFSGTDTSICSSNAFCVVPFPAVPAGKRLVLESITALVSVGGGGIPNFLAFGDFFVTNDSNISIVAPIFTPSISLIGTTFYALDRPVRVYYEPGTTPKIKIGVSTNFSFVNNLTLAGYLIDIANP